MLTSEKLYAPLDVQRRADRRVAFLEPCFIQSDSRALWVRSINLSDGGMCVAMNEFGTLKRDMNLTIFIQNFTPIDAQVRWTRGNIAGMKFLTPVVNHPQLSALIKRLHEGSEARRPLVRENIDDRLPNSLQEMLAPISVKPNTAKNTSTTTSDYTEQRAHKRTDYNEKCLIRTDKRTFQAQSKDISEGGMCLRLLGLGKVDIGADIQVILPGGFPAIDASLRWMKDREIGVKFHQPIKGHPVLLGLDDSSTSTD